MNEEMESTILDTSGNDPAPVVDFAPLDPAPEEVTPRLEPETPEKPVEVVSVDELLDRLTDTEGTTGEAEETTEAGTELEENTETGEIPGEPVVVGPFNSPVLVEPDPVRNQCPEIRCPLHRSFFPVNALAEVTFSVSVEVDLSGFYPWLLFLDFK